MKGCLDPFQRIVRLCREILLQRDEVNDDSMGCEPALASCRRFLDSEANNYTTETFLTHRRDTTITIQFHTKDIR